MEGFEVTKLGERGQVVIPLEFRKSMGLRGGDKFIVLGQGDTLLLRKLRAPTMEEFEEMLKEGQAFAKKHHLAEKDVEDAIKKARAAKHEGRS
ncbi:MAG: AbrB/MazE/SpoVT family DNA-binding domain-containing protein [Candidatus Woesearchaeota archaeon]